MRFFHNPLSSKEENGNEGSPATANTSIRTEKKSNTEENNKLNEHA